MKKFQSTTEPQHQPRTPRVAGMILLWVAGVVGLRIGFDWDEGRPANQTEIAADARKNVPKAGKADGGEKLEDFGGSQVGKTVTSGSQRQPLQFRAKAVEPAAMLAVLASYSCLLIIS